MSKYVARMKEELLAFNGVAIKAREEMSRNLIQYQPHIAANENARIQAELNRAADDANDKIDAIRSEAEEAVKDWATPSGEEADVADMRLLTGSVHLSNDDLNHLLVKHQTNGTMVNAIAKYAKEHDLRPNYIPNAGDKLVAYSAFARSAHDMVGRMVGGVGLDGQDVSGLLAVWAAPENISQRMELALYGIEDQERTTTPKGKFSFNFRSLSGR